MPSPLVYALTAWRLGLLNVARAAGYRLLKRSGFFRWRLPRASATPLGTAFSAACEAGEAAGTDRTVVDDAESLLSGRFDYFSVHRREIDDPPDWFRNPFSGVRHAEPAAHWSDIADFGDPAGDIKIIWELSRFSWAPVLARAWRLTGDVRYGERLQRWMADWWRRNPPNVGPNWKCGQESSIRLINVLMAATIMRPRDVAALEPFVVAHCDRISATTFYAVAQDNNHATSEGTALFIGGLWLAQHGSPGMRVLGRRWSARGRGLLEKLVPRLVLEDGSFSQQSIVYHRLMLDTLVLAEAWRRRSREPGFSARFVGRAAAAVHWLGAMIDRDTGDVPNLGANDGALPYRLGRSAFRDFRPSLQAGAMAFVGAPALPPGPWDEPAAWLGLKRGSAQPWLESRSVVFDRGGYVVLRAGDSMACVRAPTARFRPSQADGLHVDLWWGSTNVLRDGGTFSYAGTDGVSEVLASVAGHNSVQFDGRDQMPRLGRFLYGAWVRVEGASEVQHAGGMQVWSGRLTDYAGAFHSRTVMLGASELKVSDEVEGFADRAVLHWRLSPGDWAVSGNECSSSFGRIRIESSVPIDDLRLEEGWESRHYLERSPVPVLSVRVSKSPASMTTTVTRA